MTMINGCRHLKILELILDFTIYENAMKIEVFPWDFIDIGVTKKFLRKEWDKAMKGEVTPNCRDAAVPAVVPQDGEEVSVYEGKN